MSDDPAVAVLRKRMDGALEALRKELAGIRTGRASANMLDPVMVEAYGQTMPLSQMGSVSVPEPRLVTVQVWDKSMVKHVEKAIRDAGLGVNPMSDGNLIRVPLPELSEDRRKELVKVAAKYAEQARVAARNVRREGMENLKKLEKGGKMSEDQQRKLEKDVQTLTDDTIKKVDAMLQQKDKEILSV
jgi:ribosome recycling factor